ncbi:MAG TPA: hypothetical protein DEB70_11150 [Planctomycetaceae bacterium]|nr:hypothetical protein [Planctomycetaceae bacterium]
MIHFTTQFDYLRDVQRSFEGGAGRVDMVGVFAKILIVAAPVVLLMAFWHYRHRIGFAISRSIVRLFSFRGRRIVQDYLVKKGVLFEIFLYTGNGVGRRIGMARATDVQSGRMLLDIVDIKPLGLNLKGARVICFTKPFTLSGKKKNAFVTFVSSYVKRGGTIREMSLLTPVRYQFEIRRRHKRKRIVREGAVRVKLWDISKRNSFFMAKPDLQTVNNPARYGKKMRLSVENISAGGIRLLIMNPSGRLPSLSPGHQFILRVSVWSPKTRKFSYFTVVGTIRSRFKGKGGSIGLGIQFTAEGMKIDGKYQWASLHGEVKALAQFLEESNEWSARS